MKVKYTLDVLECFDEYADADKHATDRFDTVYDGPKTQKVNPRDGTHTPVYRYAVLKDGELYRVTTHRAHAVEISENPLLEGDLEVIFCNHRIDRDAKTLTEWDWEELSGIGEGTASRIEEAASQFSSVSEMIFRLDEIKGIGEGKRDEVINQTSIYDWTEVVDIEEAIEIHKRCRGVEDIDEALERADELFPEEHREAIEEHLIIERDIL